MNEVTFKETHLPPLEKQKKKRTPLIDVIINLILFLSLAILPFASGLLGQMLYNNLNYSHFFVNGMSMYPTINFNAYATYLDGSKIDLTYNSGMFNNTSYVYRCETGIADESEGFHDRIERFSIVCTYYGGTNGDYRDDGTLKSTAARKIKRVIGLPGESLYFDENGDLYVKEAGEEEYEYVAEPFLEEQSWWTDEVRECVSAGKRSYTANLVYTLEDDEYFVCGDNRSQSSDSRSPSNGPVKSSYIQGIVVAINGETDYTYSYENKEWSTHSDIWDYYWPWNYRMM